MATPNTIQLSINTFDSIILGVVALSTLIAFFRGFMRELLSFGAWIGAAVITIYLFPHVDQMMKGYVKTAKLASASGAIVTFIIALITISIINSIILRYVKDTHVGLLDNFLGMIFGALRGAFIVSFAYLVIQAVVPKSPEPEWLKTSITKNYLKTGSDMLVSAAPKYMMDVETAFKKQTDHEVNPQNYNPPSPEHDYHPGQTQELNNSIR